MDDIASTRDLKHELSALRSRLAELEKTHARTLGQLEQERRILQIILDGIRDGVVVADETGYFRHFNQVATDILGIGLTDAPHHEWAATYGVFLPDTVTQYPADQLPLVRAIKGEKVDDADLFIRNPERPNGLWLSCAASPLFDEDGDLRGGIVVFRDVTQERRAARLIRERDEKLRSLTSELIVAEDRERKRIAADLHDGLGQILSLVQLKLVGLIKDGDPPGEELGEIYDLVRETHESIRSLTFRISPPILHDLGLGPAIQWLVEDLGNRFDLEIHFASRGTALDLGERERILLYRAVRELVLNAEKHAGVKSVEVSLTWGRQNLVIRVADEGSGFDPETQILAGQDGFGLFSIRERLHHLGGTTRIDSAPGTGTRVEIELPIDRDSRS